MIPTKGDPSKTVATFFINNGRRYLAFGNFFHIRITSDDYFNAAKQYLQDADWPVRETGDTDCRIYGVELLGRDELAPLFAELDDLVSTSGPMPVSLMNQQPMTRTALLQFVDYNVNNVWAAVNTLTAKVDALAAHLDVPAVVITPPAATPPPTYTVVKGDNLSAIATTLRCTTNALVAANPAITDRNVLAVGQVLTIPRVG